MVLNQYKNYGTDDPASDYSTKEIMKNIEALEEDFKMPLKMHYEGYKYKEIADRLNLNIGTVKSRIFFSRKKLTERLHGYQAA
jgi:RNA polymerase sigma-70 factor (ECF subfamily)